MRIDSHLAKIAKLDALRARLDPDADFEIWFWTTMNLGTQAVNAALHHCGATREDDAFPTQPGVYLTVAAGGSLESSFRALGDVLHVGRPKVEAPVPPDVAAMMEAMEIIEHHRDPCIRGEREPTPEIAKECAEAINRVMALLRARMGT
jgi:hypothetical protein